MPPDEPPLPEGAVPGESRRPMAIAVIGMTVLIVLPPYAFPALAITTAVMMLVLLGVAVVSDPGRIDDMSPHARRVSLALVGFLLLAALGSTVILMYDIVFSAPLTKDAPLLLFVGAKVWVGNNVAFSLLYWQLDRGGPAERARALRPYADLAFPQDQNPDIRPPDWRPRFWDYLYVGFTTANAFSPTDTMPLTHWAKLAMGMEALISFLLVGLIIASAINAL
ncbi:MAG: DUF1345 domain-containing protein [Chloroflexota bacterium]